MKLDDELKERLHAVADRVPVGDPEVRGFVRRGRRRSRTKVASIAAAVVVLLAGAGILGNAVMRSGDEALRLAGGTPHAAGRDSEEGRQSRSPAYSNFGRPHGAFDRVVGLSGESDLFESQSASEANSDQPLFGFSSGGAEAAPAPQPSPVTGPSGPDAAEGPDDVSGIGTRIVKTARIEVEVEEGRFQERFSDVGAIADRYNGFVTASATEGEDSRSGRVVIRVPVARFNAALDDLIDLGVLRAQEVRGADVTEDFVDLQGRLKIHKSRQAFLFRKLDDTNSIGQSIHLHRLLEEVQFDIEDLRGQLRLLRDQSNFGTIDVSMFEVGAPPIDDGFDEGTSPLASAWDRAWHGFQTVLAAIVVGLGYLLPVLVLLVLLWIGVRQVRARTA